MPKCAICGGLAGTVLDTTIDDQPVCKECRREAQRIAQSEKRDWLPLYFETLRTWLNK